MMNPLSFFRYPAYLYNPKQVFRRIWRELHKPTENDLVRLPWGHKFIVNSGDFIGKAIAAQGIHELDVCEAIARIARPGDTVVDVGANIGFMTSLMAKAVGHQGCVFAFEPHPGLHLRLLENVRQFADRFSGRVIAEAVALSDSEGEENLVFDSALFASNSGSAGLCDSSFAQGAETVRVVTAKLDRFIVDTKVALLKIDVEGAELRVLRGAERALRERRIAAVIYEDFRAADSGIVPYLNGFGFSVFHLDRSLFRPHFREVDDRFRQIPRGRDENFLAVLDRDRLIAAYHRRGWRVFRL
jgi:FkbM family methyltransferase